MSELQLSRRLAEIIVYGHGLLFFYALCIWQFGHLEGADVLQMVLTGSPLLALIGISAFRHVMAGNRADTTPPTDRTQRQMSQIACAAFIVALALVYTGGLRRVPLLTSDTLQILVGAIETTLGAYLGIIKDKFFVRATPAAA